ncbi:MULTISPECIES: hypothetical protein [Okeania]|uniref:Uncharacterized protein n=1 Tax=Okeania hirsuta TaxID=1458930 RepID=A0A3N6PRL6_9CYAN|nr:MULTISPECIES: hypothetical protein [Okeania]NES88319.1 hypothetical protein [Okeania sp. SIO2B9]RQH06226.1 hypothetical protein D4Z78_30360 [Okeania hirsuta]RQH38961.1 hypothetical protein D5R40_17450 [Okeania hirsuta]
MSGFIGAFFGLFGGNKDDNQPKEAFFLDADSASSLGDVNFMRKSIAVKRSYPKAAGKINLIEGETEKSASSMQVKETIGETKTASYASSASISSSSTTPTTVKPRSISNSNSEIDFTSMARNIKKKR